MSKSNGLSDKGIVAVCRNAEYGLDYMDMSTFSADMAMFKQYAERDNAKIPSWAKAWLVDRYIVVVVNEMVQDEE